ncbi:MAG: class I SAM-dependent methyltransferase [Defluviitaleaceae bacterium]|nr:class I SAM-dependent methyltransferase [Defluviitaleaceae bacterium]
MNIFDIKAKGFDTDERIERAKFFADEIRLHIKDGASKTAMEYGCGTGLVGIRLFGDFKSVLFVDSSIGMIEQVKQKLIGINKPAEFAICRDFLIDCPNDLNADYIFTALTLHHIKNTKAILSHFFNVLNAGGHLLVIDINTDDGGFHADSPFFDGHHGFSQDALAGLVSEIGFANVNAKTFYRGSKKANGTDKPYSVFILDAAKRTE